MVKGLYSYVKDYGRESTSSLRLKVSKDRLEELENYIYDENNSFKFSSNINSDGNDPPLNFIIDGNAYFYSIEEKLNWFINDNIELLKILKKVYKLNNYFIYI